MGLEDSSNQAGLSLVVVANYSDGLLPTDATFHAKVEQLLRLSALQGEEQNRQVPDLRQVPLLDLPHLPPAELHSGTQMDGL